MRRPLIMLPTLVAFAALGCEDGPNQPYQAAPENAGNVWNSGNTKPVAADGGQDFDAGYPTSSKTALCSNDFKRKRWAWMLTQPIEPPRFYAGLDMAKNDQWDGLTIEDAETPPDDPASPSGGLCQSTPLGYEGSCPSGFGGCNGNAWGDANEVFFSWNVSTHLVDQMQLNLGYTGTMQTVKYPDHLGEEHEYKIGIGDIVRRDGEPFEIQWTDSVQRAIQITDIFNATMATFAKKAGIPFDTSSCTDDSTCATPTSTSICECKHKIDPNTQQPLPQCESGSTGKCGVKNCGKDGNCLIYDDGSTTIFGIRPMVIYVQGTAGVPQPALSTPQGIYNFFSKWEPFSNLPQVVKLDAEGPVAKGNPVGDPTGNKVCLQQIGQTFADFQANCVQVHGDASDPNGVDAVNLNKVLHSLTHDQDSWTANVLGVNQNFTSVKVLNNPDIVVLDKDTPQPEDIAQDWTFDLRARGRIANDYDAGPDIYTPGTTPTLQGSALVMIEWARLMLDDIAKMTGQPVKALGDPSCTGFDAQGNPNYYNSTGCSGIEGMIIPNAAASYGTVQVDFTGDPLRPDLDPGANADVYGIYPSLLKPGGAAGAFCIDPGSESDCTADQGVSLFQNALQHVRRVMGHGDVLNLPSELRDRRYYFKWFGVAYVKYLKAYGNYAKLHGTKASTFPTGTVGSGLGPSDVMNTEIDLESLFFDYTDQQGSGAAQTFDKFEYIDREFIGQGSGGKYNNIPWDFEYGCDLFGGNQRYDNWFRRMDREEIALYSAMLTDKSKAAGQENNVNLTNLFGSTLLGGDPASAVSGVWPSYLCAIGQAGDPAANCGVNAPLEPANPSGSADCFDGTCANATDDCGGGPSFENGYIQRCGIACDFTAHPASGCASKSQTCVPSVVGGPGACLDMKMDKNGADHSLARPILAPYPGVWARTPFSRGHSSITLKESDKHAEIGVAKASIPNFVVDPANPYTTGPYTDSPVKADDSGACPDTYTLATGGVWCDAPVSNGTGNLAPKFSALTPWLEVQPSVGFKIPLDAQHYQWVSGGQLDFTGVLETYLVDYRPYTDPSKASCVDSGTCNKGYKCDPASKDCVTDDDTIRITGIEGADFLGQVFACIDPSTSDILHVGMYDSAESILDWLAAHPGSSPGYGTNPSAQAACQILVIRSPYDNYVDFIISKTYGVSINIGGGQGQGRVTDIVVWDPTLVQAL